MTVRRSFPAPRHERTRARAFGRAPVRDHGTIDDTRSIWGIGEELKLFGMTFAAGFVFVSVLIG